MGVFKLLSFIVQWSVQAVGDSLDWLALDQIASRATALFQTHRPAPTSAKPRRAPVPASSSPALQA